MVKLVVLYGHPEDPEAFEREYAETHLPLARKIPGLQRLALARFTGTPTGAPPSYYRMAELFFESAEALGAAMGSPEGRAAGADAVRLAKGKVTFSIAEVEE